MKYNTNMFDSIRDAISKQKPSSGARDIVTFEKGNTYVVRLIPNMEDPEKTWFKYQSFSWNSFATGQYTSVISPLSWGERCPISEARIVTYRNGTDEQKEKIKNVRRSDRWLMKAWIISDPTNPDNNGKIKPIRFGKQLFNIINNAIVGEDAEEFGSRVFDFGPSGVNLKIKVTDLGGFANYTESRFTSPIDLKLTDAQIEEIYKQGGGLESIFACRPYDEIKKVFDEHYHCIGASHTISDQAPRVEADSNEGVGGQPADGNSDDEVTRVKNLLKSI